MWYNLFSQELYIIQRFKIATMPSSNYDYNNLCVRAAPLKFALKLLSYNIMHQSLGKTKF